MQHKKYKITLINKFSLKKSVVYENGLIEAIRQLSNKDITSYNWSALGVVRVSYKDGSDEYYYWDMVRNNFWQRLKDKFL